MARDGEELGRTLQAIIDQGATSGNFSASRQSITDSVYEYVYLAGTGFDATDPDTRYKALAPTRLISTFSLPGFRGELTAWQDRDGNGILDPVTDVAWKAGEKLLALVQDGFVNCLEGPNLCTFAEISGPTGIQRRIYTTDGNGVFYDSSNPVSLAGYAEGTSIQAARETLWPLSSPADEPFPGFDSAVGIGPPPLLRWTWPRCRESSAPAWARTGRSCPRLHHRSPGRSHARGASDDPGLHGRRRAKRTS